MSNDKVRKRKEDKLIYHKVFFTCETAMLRKTFMRLLFELTYTLATQQDNERCLSLTWESVGLSQATEPSNTSQQSILRQFSKHKLTELAALSVPDRSRVL